MAETKQRIEKAKAALATKAAAKAKAKAAEKSARSEELARLLKEAFLLEKELAAPPLDDSTSPQGPELEGKYDPVLPEPDPASAPVQRGKLLDRRNHEERMAFDRSEFALLKHLVSAGATSAKVSAPPFRTPGVVSSLGLSPPSVPQRPEGGGFLGGGRGPVDPGFGSRHLAAAAPGERLPQPFQVQTGRNGQGTGFYRQILRLPKAVEAGRPHTFRSGWSPLDATGRGYPGPVPLPQGPLGSRSRLHT